MRRAGPTVNREPFLAMPGGASTPYDPLIHGGALRDRADLTLAAILRAMLVVLPVTIAANLIGAGSQAGTLTLCALLAYVVVLFLLQRRGHFSFCVHAAVFGLIGFSSFIAGLFGSVRSVGTMGLVAAITIGGIFLGRRASILAAVMSIASIGALIVAENAGWLPAPNYQVTAMHWVNYSMIIAAIALILAYMRSLLLDVVRRLGDELQERRRAEAGRRQSEERFRRVFDLTPLDMTITRLSDGRYLEVNRSDLTNLGYRRDELIGRTTLEMGAWPSSEERARFLDLLRANGRIQGFTARMRNKAGDIVKCQIWADLIEFDGEPCVLASTVNVTHQERADLLLSQSEAKYAAIFKSAPDPIVIARKRDGALIEANEAWVRTTGHRRADALGRSAAALGIWTDGAERAKVVEQIEARGSVENVPARFTMAGGASIDTLLSGISVDLDGESCIVWSWRDISGIRRVEEEKRQVLEKFTTLFETNPVGCILTRPRDHRVVEVNDAALKLLGVSREEALARPTLEIVRWTDKALRDEVRERVLAGERVIDIPAQLEGRGGTVFDTLASAAPIRIDGEALILITVHDVTAHRRADEELRRSRRLLETVIDALPTSVFVKDVDSNYIMLNQRMAEFFGQSKQALLNRHTQCLPVHAATRAKSLADDRWVFENLRTLDQPDVPLARPDGVEIDYHSTKIPLFDEAGKVMGLLGINRDITEEKRAQAALRESENRYRSLFQALGTPVVLSRLRDGVIVDVNDAWSRENGIAREQAIGQRGTNAGHWTDLEARERILQQVMTEGRADDHRVRFVRTDGREREVKVSCTRIELNGEPHLLWTSRDVTERRRNERLLSSVAKGVNVQTGSEFFRSLVLALCRELPADVAFIGEIADDGTKVRTIACCSDGVMAENFEYALEGSPCALAIEKRGTVIYPQNVAPQFPQDVGLAQRGIDGYVGTSLHDSDGKAIGVLVALTRAPIARTKLYMSLLEIFAARAAAEIARARAYETVRELNVTLERRVRERTAELESANRQLNSFGYSVSHDLRSPLGAIAGFADLLRETESGRLSGEGETMLAEIETNATRMHLMLEGLLEFSRLGYKPVAKSVVPMSAVVADVVEGARLAGGAPAIEFRVGGIPDAQGDPILLRQVWANLIGNAVKYSRSRQPAIVEVGYDPAAAAYYVRDNGVGFEMKYAGRLFDVFERLHSSAEYEGTGVGLAIVQHVVQRHGGEVSAESEPGRGATFSFTLPAA